MRGKLLVLTLIACILGAYLANQLPARGDADDMVPQLSFKQEQAYGRSFSYVHIVVPGIPGCHLKVWCYEDAYGNGTGELQPDGSLVIRHQAHGVKLQTHLIPEHGALRWEVTATSDDLQNLRWATVGINPCWQMQPGENFMHQGSFPYDFLPRCFIYTIRGFTPMDQTVRMINTDYPPDNEYNNPPWVQVYVPVWRRHPGQPESFWGNSTDRTIYGLIGCVSRDGKWLVAFGNGGENSWHLSQGWHDCLHLHPSFTYLWDGKAKRIVWRAKMYFMENNPDRLLRTYLADFPQEQFVHLAVTPAGEALMVAPKARPELKLRLGAPRLHGTLHAAMVAPWRGHPWGAWSATGRGPHARYRIWARPYDDFVDIYLTVANDGSRPLQPQVSATLTGGPGWEPLAIEGAAALQAAGGWVAGLRWEARDETVDPGGKITLRGRLYVLNGDVAALQQQLDDTVAEWERSLPVHMPLP